ncbi:RlmE family RNA methyltransferase [Candidatus Peregrinibacteria bacterium]|jgi:23S rRNA (uridine2552-2'-O)-methyltransferase|nr:RlmE family RNA methyltransferase [Candidatus Peregrinibacteria bacterium]MBT7483753.1 RlmE family RNA methyltransferase [Candidatus Peregrinibacteria bacterium]MBT7703725.1 RlmE family RNA methyltransferase [Candidatus Peregrinibacteria bacterium]
MPKQYRTQDKYFKRAKERGLRARSAFKLEEIQKKFRLVRDRDMVADLGAAPGSWSQVLSKWVGPGKIFALDLQAIEEIAPNVLIYQVDITDEAAVAAVGAGQVDGVVADLAPKTTGQHDVDAYHSAELNHAVLNFCEKHLKKRGYVITKIFQGEDFQQVVKRAKKKFKRVKCFKPESCRDRSRETYIVGQGFLG